MSHTMLAAMTMTRAFLFKNVPNPKMYYFSLLSIWCVYLVLAQYLYVNTEIRHFETEGYITAMTIGEAWEFANRPIIVPMIYKAFQNYGVHIVRFQYAMSILAWTFLGLVTTMVLKNRLLAAFGFALILAFSLSGDVYFWNSMLLSESLSHSLMILLVGLTSWIAFGELGGRKKRWMIMFTVACGVMWGFTRDANAYLLLVWGGGLAFWAGFSARTGCFWLLMIAYMLIFAFVVNYRHAEQGKRWQLSYINVLGERILPDPEARAFFAECGLPLNDDVTRYTNQRAWTYFPNHDMRLGLGDWLDEDGRQVYAEYLVSHPVATLTAPIISWKPVLAYQYRLVHLAQMYDTGAIPRWQRIIDGWVFSDRLVMPSVLLVCFGIMGWGVFRSPDYRYFIPTCMILNAYGLAFVAWHGDADSVERHAFQATILVRLSVFVMVLILIDQRINRVGHSVISSPPQQIR